MELPGLLRAFYSKYQAACLIRTGRRRPVVIKARPGTLCARATRLEPGGAIYQAKFRPHVRTMTSPLRAARFVFLCSILNKPVVVVVSLGSRNNRIRQTKEPADPARLIDQ